jgi:abortive infection bacteriophage resistance protein
MSASDNYHPGTTLGGILDIYNFDSQLRLVMMDAVEKVEIWLRTALTYEIAHRCGAFGYLKKSSFNRGFKYQTFRKTLRDEQQRSKESFVQHYRTKYTAENHLPIWMATELLTFGTLSMLYSQLPLDSKRAIADKLGLADNVLANWLQSTSYLRNMCAHHSRIWNRKFATSPKVLKKDPRWKKVEQGKIYASMLSLEHILEKIDPNNGWLSRIKELIRKNPHIETRLMGFPSDWQSREPFNKV